MTALPVSDKTPSVSVIMPTLNAEAILENCLASIARQDYRGKIEILIADAMSTDRTREIAGKFGAIVLDDHGKNMEEGKRLALRHATGDYILFVDADNELSHPDYLALAVNALVDNPQALGVEGYYLPSERMSSFCVYVTALLHISDPVAWLMSSNPVLVARDGDVERWALPEGSYAYPLGANGFVYRRADLESVNANEKFQDTHVALFLMKNGKREWLRIHGRGVHHYYIQTVWGFIKKRRRSTVHFLRVQEEMPVNWMKEKPLMPLWLAAAYCVTFFGPLWHVLRGVMRDRDLRWLWHLVACPASIVGNAWGVFTYKRRGKDKKLIADLQVNEGGGRGIWRSGIVLSATFFIVGLGNFAFQAIIGNKLIQSGEYGFVNTTLGLIALLGLPLQIAVTAITHYIARFNHHGEGARLRGLLAGCQKFLFRLTIAGSLLAILLIKPLGNLFHFPRTGLTLAALVCVLLQLWGGLATALCQGLSWFRRLALINFAGMCLRLLFCWLVVRQFPLAEWAVLATGVAMFSNLILLRWKNDLAGHAEPVSPWNRELFEFFVVAAACVGGGFLFQQGDVLVAQRYFSKTELDAYTGAAVFARALPITVAPLLTVLFTHRSTAHTGHALREQMKLMGIYFFGLVCGFAGLLLLKADCLKLINKFSPESNAMVTQLALPMVFVGLLQAIGTWALASRWVKIALLYGVLGLLYWLTLFFFGKTPWILLHLMPITAGMAFATLFFTWTVAMRRGTVGK